MFITTLPIIFTYTGLFTPIEAIIFLIVVYCLVYFYAPEVNAGWIDNPAKGLYHILLSEWLGIDSLWRAFWPFFLLVNGVLYYIDYRVANSTYTINSWKTVHGMLFLPIVWWITAVWRCSANTRYKFWAGAARSVTLCLIIEFCLRFLISTQYPNTLFDCQLLLAVYGDCL